MLIGFFDRCSIARRRLSKERSAQPPPVCLPESAAFSYRYVLRILGILIFQERRAEPTATANVASATWLSLNVRQKMKLVDILKDKKVLSFTIYEHGLCVLGLSAEYGLSAECLVRFIGHDGAFITARDHGHQFGSLAPFDAAAAIEARVKGQVIDRASVCSETSDLTLYFGSDRLEIFCTSRGYEAYNLRGPNNLTVVVHGGREKPNKSLEPMPLERHGSS